MLTGITRKARWDNVTHSRQPAIVEGDEMVSGYVFGVPTVSTFIIKRFKGTQPLLCYQSAFTALCPSLCLLPKMTNTAGWALTIATVLFTFTLSIFGTVFPQICKIETCVDNVACSRCWADRLSVCHLSVCHLLVEWFSDHCHITLFTNSPIASLNPIISKELSRERFRLFAFRARYIHRHIISQNTTP